MKSQGRFRRLYILGAKKTRIGLLGLRPAAFKGRYCGPRVLMNSLPKSGTNLLESALLNLPYLRGGLRRTLVGSHDISDAVIAARIRCIKKGQFIAAHLPFNQDLLSLIKDEGIGSLLMVRDPRDTAVSHFKYLSEIDLTHNFHGYFAQLPTDDARLLASIEAVVGAFKSYAGWLDDPNTLIVRFEDLIGSAGGGNQDRQLKAIRDIANHLGIVMSDEKIHEMLCRIFSTKTPTFRSGKIGGWKKSFKPEHVKVFKDIGGEMIIRYGYEKDLNW